MTSDQGSAGRFAALSRAAQQEQFLEVIPREEVEARLARYLKPAPCGVERVPLSAARGRVLAEDVTAPVDVPGFDRASVDGFALRAAETAGASRALPAVLRLNAEVLTPGVTPRAEVVHGTASVIATGGMLPRGADAVAMVEDTETSSGEGGAPSVEIHRPVAPGRFVALAGSDITRGETVLRSGRLLSSREIAMLAALGLGEIAVWRRPRIAVLSTGDEIVAPGSRIRPGQVYDSNAAVLAASVEELGGEPVRLGIVPDDEPALFAALECARASADLVLLSGGTSKGAGDIAHRVVARLTDPGVIVHGVALKPGKPLCLAVSAGKLIAVLPGFPTSAIFTFESFIAPIIARMAGRRIGAAKRLTATLPLAVTSERGRTEYVMVSLMRLAQGGFAAYPIAKGSGAVTSFAEADGFFEIAADCEAIAAATDVTVTLIGEEAEPADLVIIGSHCVGLDYLTGILEREGIRVKALNVGSSGGLAAAERGACDIAPIHLMDPRSGRYNTPFLTDRLVLLPGYLRQQGIVFRRDDARFAACASAAAALALAIADGSTLMVNRNGGSGTRILIDRLLGGQRPAGYSYQVKSHNGVAIAIAQQRADWGVAIENVARQYGLAFLPLQAEEYDFAIPRARLQTPSVRRFAQLLQDATIRRELEAMGFRPVAENA
ncbi:MAG: molybdopterin biosynthesis protein [Acetobacteraceae bacterium]